MLAAVLEKPGTLSIVDIPDPQCPENGMLVAVEYCAVCSSDLKMFKSGHRALRYPVVLGHEIVGRVIKVHGSKGDFKVGEYVVVGPGVSCCTCEFCLSGRANLCRKVEILGFNRDGGLAEVVAIESKMLDGGWIKRIPKDLDLKLSTLVEPLACCINGHEKVRINNGSKVLIIGGGPIGCMHGWLCQMKGAARVIILETNATRKEQVKELDVADEVYETLPLGEAFNVLILACSYFPDPGFLDKRLEPGSQILLFSGMDNKYLSSFSWGNLIHYREWCLMGAYGCRPDQLGQALYLINQGEINVGKLLGCTYSLSETLRALKDLEEKKILKAVISIRK